MILWVELPAGVDTLKLHADALKHRINTAPGPLFSVKDRYHNCLRMNCAMPWTAEIDAALKTLATWPKDSCRDRSEPGRPESGGHLHRHRHSSFCLAGPFADRPAGHHMSSIMNLAFAHGPDVAFATIYLVWGSTYLGIRVAVETLPPFLMAGARFLVAGGLLMGWLAATRGFRATRASGATTP
jgi:hypothetical protein